MKFAWKMSSLSVIATAAFVASSANGWAGINLVKNGDFEQNGGTGQLAQGITSLADWTVGPANGGGDPFDFVLNDKADSEGFRSVYYSTYNSNIFLWGPGTPTQYDNFPPYGDQYPVNNGFTGSPNGGYFFGSDGAYATAPLQQTIDGLTVGAQYTLSFEWAASQFAPAAGPTDQSWSVSFGSDSVQTPTYSLPSQGFSGWMTFTQTFTATSASQVLSFMAKGTPDNLPPFPLLDGVSLTLDTAAVPEPSSVLMLGLGSLGLVGVGLARRARRSEV